MMHAANSAFNAIRKKVGSELLFENHKPKTKRETLEAKSSSRHLAACALCILYIWAALPVLVFTITTCTISVLTLVTFSFDLAYDLDHSALAFLIANQTAIGGASLIALLIPEALLLLYWFANNLRLNKILIENIERELAEDDTL